MLERRFIGGKWIYRVPGTLVWSYSRRDALERENSGGRISEQVNQKINLMLYANTRHGLSLEQEV